jgi:hypothetical protein
MTLSCILTNFRIYLCALVALITNQVSEVTGKMDIPIEKILERLDLLEYKYDQLLRSHSQRETENFPSLLTLTGLVEYLLFKMRKRIAKSTIYGWVNKKTVPYIKRDHSLLFEREKIDAWLLSGRKSTYEEIMAKADLGMVTANRKRGSHCRSGQ